MSVAGCPSIVMPVADVPGNAPHTQSDSPRSPKRAQSVIRGSFAAVAGVRSVTMTSATEGWSKMHRPTRRSTTLANRLREAGRRATGPEGDPIPQASPVSGNEPLTICGGPLEIENLHVDRLARSDDRWNVYKYAVEPAVCSAAERRHRKRLIREVAVAESNPNSGPLQLLLILEIEQRDSHSERWRRLIANETQPVAVARGSPACRALQQHRICRRVSRQLNANFRHARSRRCLHVDEQGDQFAVGQHTRERTHFRRGLAGCSGVRCSPGGDTRRTDASWLLLHKSHDIRLAAKCLNCTIERARIVAQGRAARRDKHRLQEESGYHGAVDVAKRATNSFFWSQLAGR